MSLLRMLALALNAAWALISVIVAIGALAGRSASLGGFAALIFGTVMLSAAVIVREARLDQGSAARTPRLIRAGALVLNAGWLLLAAFGWAMALVGVAGPDTWLPLLLAAGWTLTAIVNLVVILRRPVRLAVDPAGRGA